MINSEGLGCVPTGRCVDVLTCRDSECDCICRVFKEINKLRPSSCALIQYDPCPSVKRTLNTARNLGEGCTQRTGRVRTQGKWLAASQGASPRQSQPQPHYDRGCPASGAARKQMSIVQPSEDMLFCHGSPSKLIHKHYIECQTT